MGKLNKKWSYEDVKKYIESFNYKLISKEYINSREKILVQCDKGHIYETTFNSFKNKKSRCPICNGGIRYNHEYVKEGAFVIDVGVNRVDGKLCGDVDFDDVIDKVSMITPVPKGVGPMTIAMLMNNVLKAYEER